MARKSRHLGFMGLSNRITREYIREGKSPKRARYIGNATAGKVAREKLAHRRKRR